MNRYTYRAKYNNEWVYGSYLKMLENTPYAVITSGTEKEEKYVHLILQERSTDWGLPKDIASYRVDETTVGQCTGKLDKNNNYIFEGDKVDILCEVEETGVIEWSDDLARFIVAADGFIADFDNYYGDDLEVIGTIYDDL